MLVTSIFSSSNIFFENISIFGLLTYSHSMTPFDASEKEAFCKHCGKGGIASTSNFSLFPQCFLLYQRQKLLFLLHSICPLQMLSIWSGPNFVVWEWVKGQVCVAKDYPFPKRQFFDSSKLKKFADDNFKLDENVSKLSKWVENTVGKG